VDVEQVSVEDSIKAAMIEVEEKASETDLEDRGSAGPIEVPENTKSRDDSGKFVKTAKEPEVQKTEIEAPEVKTTPLPQSLPADLKEKYAAAPPELRDWINKRELDQHQMMTRHDGELRLGREMKDVIAPYLPIIQAQGVTPTKVVQDLLGTAHRLGSGDMATKVAVLQDIARNYGVDLAQVQTQAPVDPYVRQLEQKIQGFEQQLNQQTTLQQQQEHDKVMSEIQAFSADPKNVYFEQVKAAMAPLLGSNQAKDLQEAYDMACWANPNIRSTLIALQAQEEAEKRKADTAKKKQAAVSITGSPGVKAPSSTTPNKTVEQELEDVYDELMGSRL